MISRTFTHQYELRVFFTRDAFSVDNDTLVKVIGTDQDSEGPAKVIVFVDSGLLAKNEQLISQIETYFHRHRETITLATSPISVMGGEGCKNDLSQVELVWNHLNDAGICRHSYVLAIGGGAVLDMVGFGAATAHRGVRLIRMPTTTLSQDDGGVGVKNGVNHFGKKNWVGSFAVPSAIVNDFSLLRTLPKRELRAGLVEAVKVALIRDGAFFEQIEALADDLAQLQDDAVEQVVQRSAELHVNHIATGGDPFEQGSARPLDFGHWAAHKLEPMSDFQVLHGEAVGIGMAIDLIYARKVGLLSPADERRILDLMDRIGFDLYHPLLDQEEDGKLLILKGLEEFREHLGGQLTVTMVTGIGQAVEVHEVDSTHIPQVMAELKERFGSHSEMGKSTALPAELGVRS